MSTNRYKSATPQTSSGNPLQGIWGMLLAFALGGGVGLLILALMPSKSDPATESPPPRTEGAAIRTHEERQAESATSRETRPAPPPRESLPAAAEGTGGFQTVGFDLLSGFEMVGASRWDPGAEGLTGTTPIPEEVKALDGEMVSVIGFMLPIRVDRNTRQARELFLMKDHSLCCYGVEPQPNEFIHVQMEEGFGAPVLTDIPVRISGQLEVRTDAREVALQGVYRMRGQSVERM